jgi:hypothetical protein
MPVLLGNFACRITQKRCACRPLAGLEVVEKLLTSFMVESSERHPGVVGVKCLQRELPGEQSDPLAAGAWLVEFQYVRTVQELHAGGS